MDEYVLAVDLGGTNLRMAAVSRDGRIHHRERRSTPRDHGTDGIISAIAELAARCREAVGAATSVGVIGVAAPAILNSSQHTIDRSPNLPMLDGVPFEKLIRDAVGVETIVENDATSAAIGEHWLGATRGTCNSICITLGTGVGGGIILNNDPLRGADGMAGEIGHICVEPNGHPCGCGSWGCLEQYASATALIRIAQEYSEISPSVISGKSDITAEAIYEFARQGDAVSVKSFKTMGFYLGLACAGLINVLNPDMIVFAGGLSAAWDAFIDNTRETMSKRAFRVPAVRVKLVRARLGDDAGILGAARLAWLKLAVVSREVVPIK